MKIKIKSIELRDRNILAEVANITQDKDPVMVVHYECQLYEGHVFYGEKTWDYREAIHIDGMMEDIEQEIVRRIK